MKLYIASSFKNLNQVKRVAAVAEEMGHTITCKWWELSDGKVQFADLSYEEFIDLPEIKHIFFRDVGGVVACDTFILLNDENLRGAYVELGIAFLESKFCIGVGKFEKSAMFAGISSYMTEDQLVEYFKHTS